MLQDDTNLFQTCEQLETRLVDNLLDFWVCRRASRPPKPWDAIGQKRNAFALWGKSVMYLNDLQKLCMVKGMYFSDLPECI